MLPDLVPVVARDLALDAARLDRLQPVVDREVLLLAGLDVLDAQVVQELAIALALGRDRVPEDGLRSNAALAIRTEVCGSTQAIDSRSWGC